MKKIIALLLALVMVLGLVACAAKPAGEKKEDPKQEEKKEEKKEESKEEHENVSFEVYIAQVDWADAWEEMEARFEEQYPWIDVQHVGLGSDADFLQTRMSTNDLPAVIQCNNGPNMNQLVAENKLADLTNYTAAQYMPKAYADAYSFDGKLVGLCQGAAFSCIFYNMDILEKAGWTNVPTNWDELIQCCKDVQEKTGVAPLVTAAGKTTTSWMIFELLIGNYAASKLQSGEYEQQFLDGKFDFTAYPELVSKLDEIAPYFLEGTAAAKEDDVTAYMHDGLAAMAIAGNWNGGVICPAIAECAGDPSKVKAGLPPFNPAGQPSWISVSPEDAFCVTVDDSRSAAEQEAIDLFFNWVWEAENFALIQNARGTVPVGTNMTEEYIVLQDALVPVVADMGSAPFVKMGFNLWTAEFKDAGCGKICDVLSGNTNAQDAVDTMWKVEQEYYINKK